jgi:2-iminobutanoate/2-iminopropanoate deaminase
VERERATVRYENPPGVPAPIGPFSHLAVSETGLVAVAGQVAIDQRGELVGAGDFSAQTEQVLANIVRALSAVALGPQDILQMTSYLVSAEHIPTFYAVRERVFPEMFAGGRYPPNTLLVVQRLVRPEFLVEIEALAVGPSTGSVPERGRH